MEEPWQQILLSECHTCSWGQAGLCNGPRDARTYLMQGDNYTTCLNTEKRELMFSDTFKNNIPIPYDSRPKLINIPSFIPTIARGMRISDELRDSVFGVSLGKIIGKRGNLRYDNLDQIKSKFGLPSSSKVALIGTSPDPQLENLWKIHETHQIFERIAKIGFEWITSLTYSVWEEEFPRPDQLKNQYRNLWTYDLFTSLGVSCIPFLFPVEEIDFRNAVRWLSERPSIDTIAVYARFYHTEDKFRWFCSFMKKIERLVDRKIRFLVCGIGKGENIARLREKFDCRFENSTMFEKTIHGLSCDSKLKYSKSVLSLEDVFRVNFSLNTEFCQKREPKPIIYLKKPKPVANRNKQPELLGLSK